MPMDHNYLVSDEQFGTAGDVYNFKACLHEQKTNEKIEFDFLHTFM